MAGEPRPRARALGGSSLATSAIAEPAHGGPSLRDAAPAAHGRRPPRRPASTTSGEAAAAAARATVRGVPARHRRSRSTEQVDVVLICGDLFDSNSQPRRSVERAAAELRRLADAARSVRVAHPGHARLLRPASIYRVVRPRRAGRRCRLAPTCSTVLTPERPDVVFPDLDLVVYGRVLRDEARAAQPARGLQRPRDDQRAPAGRSA